MSKIAIVGYATEGKVSLEYFSSRGHEVTVCDRNENIKVPNGFASQLGDGYLNNLDNFDLIVRSAGIQPSVIIEANPSVGDKITTAVNEFLANCPTHNTIGITGTKGKGTTSTLVAKMLEAAGKKVWLGGNIGNSPLEFIDKIQPDDWVVLELSSFQLIDIKHSPHIAACLMISTDHIDWHGSELRYQDAKKNLFRWQVETDHAVYFAKNEKSKEIADCGKGKLTSYFSEPGAFVENDKFKIANRVICGTRQILLLGEHNWENICAALTICWIVAEDAVAYKKAIQNFKGLPYRIEPLGTLKGIRYFNDSFASNSGATIAAIRAIDGPIILLIGGYDRMVPLDKLINNIKQENKKIKRIVAYGAAKERVAKEFGDAGIPNLSVCEATSMPQLLKFAQSFAEESDAIVLSPGFPSFDMFSNFEERGQQFNNALEKTV